MEYFPLGSLDNFIHENKMREKDARMICVQVLEGLASMHKVGFAHRDLKPGVRVFMTGFEERDLSGILSLLTLDPV